MCHFVPDESLLSIDNLAVSFPGNERQAPPVRVVDGVSLTMARGETVGVVGESGSGKSMTALSILRLVPAPGRIVQGTIILDDQNLLALPPKAMRSVRGGRIAMIFQDPMTSLNPVFTVGEQIAEAVRVHRKLGRRAAAAEAVEALRGVHIALPERRAKQYPFELSGGMRQRVMIALALACRPDVLLADEPTTALDVTVQAQILALIGELRRGTGMAVLLITHDLGVVAETCDRVLVMYAGQVMETADVHALFGRPAHPYTQGLLASLPEKAPHGATRLPFIAGQPPASAAAISGCPFRTRCPKVMPGVCEKPLPTTTLGITSDGRPGHVVRCHLYPAFSLSPPAPQLLPSCPPSLGGDGSAGRDAPAGRTSPARRDSGTEQGQTSGPTHSSPPKLGGQEGRTLGTEETTR